MVSNLKNLFISVREALKRCKIYSLSIFPTYCLSCFIGIIMSHNGNNYSLLQRDKIIQSIVKNDKAALNYQSGNKFRAALYDCEENLFNASTASNCFGIGYNLPIFFCCISGLGLWNCIGE